MEIKDELYVSVDVEADGDTPATSSMLSIGAVTINSDYTLGKEFYVNILEAPEKKGKQETLDWWQSSKVSDRARELLKTDRKEPKVAMQMFADWLNQFPEKNKVLVAYPVGYESMWLQCYFDMCDIKNPFKHDGVDIRSEASFVLNYPYRKTSYKVESGEFSFPKEWISDLNKQDSFIPHYALHDAKHQGDTFIRMMKWRNRQTNFPKPL